MRQIYLKNSTLLVGLTFIGVGITSPRMEHHSAQPLASAEIPSNPEQGDSHAHDDPSGDANTSHQHEHEGTCTCLGICDVGDLSFDIDVDLILLLVHGEGLLAQPLESTNDELYLVPPDFILPFADGPPRAT